ncbi:MAG: immunoglobulin domain-containing protein, partial [Flavobacteriales bacterium]
MKFPTLKTLLGGMALMTGLTAGAQGLEGVIVEEYHTITQADADFINAQSPTYAMPVGAKVYRVYIDMAPNYRFLNVVASADNSNPVNFQTTTTFWNTTDMAGGSADFSPAQTRNLPRGLAFDSYITIHTTGKSGSTVLACTAFGGGSSANTQQVGVLRSADSNGNGTLCNSYPGFTGADGHIQNPFANAVPALSLNLSGTMDFAALEADGNQFTFINDAWATLPAQTGVDPTGTNRVLVGQFTTNGVFTFKINVALSNPSNQVEEYFHTSAANPGSQVSPFLTYPQACVAPVITSATSNGPICAGAALNLSAAATGDATITYSWSGPNSFSSTQQNPTITAATVAAAGTYTVTASNGCAPNATATVNVVVNPSTTNTTTVSQCDSYTWPVNGTTYTQSGTYTSVSGCATQTLVLTITPSTNNTTTVSECDSYTWAVNGTTYT